MNDIKTIFVLILLFFSFTGCNNTSKSHRAIGFTKQQRIIADKVINIFEYSKVKIEYGHAEIVDGDEVHGVTAGRLGFTSATGDMLDLIKNYYNQKPLSKYIPELERLHKFYAKNNYQTSNNPDGSMNVDGLDGLINDWNIQSNKKDFQEAQDKYLDIHYFSPALKIAKDNHLTLPLSLLCIYDSAIQNGVEGAETLVKKTKLKKPTNITEEINWIKDFNKKRKALLKSKPEWSDTTYRISTLNRLIDEKKYNLDIKQITIEEWGNEKFDLVSSFNEPVMIAQLQIQKLDGSSVKNIDADDCYSSTNDTISFHIPSNTLKRCELRLSEGNEWALSDDKNFVSQVKFSDIKMSGSKEFSWMQLHHYQGNKKPFIRLAWINDTTAHKDTITGNKYSNGLWAIVRKDDKISNSKGENYYYFDQITKNKFITSEIKIIDNGKKIYIRIEGKDIIINTPTSWTQRDASDYYFKAGLYFSGSKNTDREVTVQYNLLKMF